MIHSALEIVEAGKDLTFEQMSDVMNHIMDGACDEDSIARLLSALHQKGETVSEVAGAASAMRRHMTPIRSTRPNLIDTCGTGGDGSKTFNISTAAAIVTAAAGVPVAKHGNRGMTSRSGSADVLAALGVNVNAGVAQVENCLETLGICFCFAPLLHASMKHVAAVRKQLRTPTIFNILGPLVNPASAPFQLLGVGRAELQPLMAEALLRLGIRRALVVHGTDGLDEVTLAGATQVMEVNEGRLRRFRWQPADFGFEPAEREEMLVSSPEESAAMILGIFDGSVVGPPREIVIINSAAALWTARQASSLLECVHNAQSAIDEGKAAELLKRLGEQTLAT
jgi:anthranilate phosphoribosyltransferase